MQKQENQQLQLSPKKNNKQGLSRFLKIEHTYSVQYQIVKQLIKIIQIVNNQQKPQLITQQFKTLYNNLSKQIKNTLIFDVLNYKLWNNQNLPIQIRQKTQFFRIVSQWIVIYQLKVSDLKNKKSQIQFLYNFFVKQTHTIFQRVVLIDQIYQDLIELLGRQFWGLKDLQQQDQQKNIQRQQIDDIDNIQQRIHPTKQQAAQFLILLSFLVQYYAFFQKDQTVSWFNCQLYLLNQKLLHYQQFIYKSIQYVLSVNCANRPAQKCLQKHQQMQLTRIALIYLQTPNIAPKKSVKLIKLLMLRTSKIVRYAMVVDYVRLYDYFQKSNQYDIIQELENMIYFRQLIIGHNQIGQAGLINNHLGKSMRIINIPARSKQRILLSHETSTYGQFSILQFQFLIETGDISVAIFNIKNGKQVQYWRQDRTEDRRVDIILRQEGLYIIEFNNLYSWIKGKKISYKLEQFCNGV